MSATPDIASIAGLIGDRARATILMALMDGRALTASELARSAEVTKATASSHLAKLLEARLVDVEQTGRHRYYRLADHDVAAVIEQLSGLAARLGATSVSTGPRDAALRRARVCYDHLAGDLGVLLLDSFEQRELVQRELVQRELVQRALVNRSSPQRSGRARNSDAARDEAQETSLTLTDSGAQFLLKRGVDIASLKMRRRPLCLACLDWSVRRHHLAGAVGAAILELCLTRGWARRQRGTRAVIFSALGERAFRKELAGT